MLAVAVSRADEVAEAIADALLDLADWTETTEAGATVHRRPGAELRYHDERHLDTDGVADAFEDPDLLVFPSRHAGDTGPLLTAHHTGNVASAEHGGEPESLARACPNAHRQVLGALGEHAPEGYEVGMEATHHGPSHVGVPSMFVEVGSGPEQWDDDAACTAVARAILALEGVAADAPREEGTRRHLVGVGGGHYAPRFERVVRETDWAVGHVLPEWALAAWDDPADHRDVLRAAFERSAADLALLEGDRPTLRETIADLGFRPVDETWVRETSGVHLDLVERVEADLGPVAAGVRLGEAAQGYEGRVVDATLPADLLDATNGLDRDTVRAAVAAEALAFRAGENGTLVRPAVALPEASARDRIVDALAGVLRQRYDVVERTGDVVVARREAFDPDRARERGVEPGPQFGRLADGEPVVVDGERIEPGAVTTERERRFQL